MTEKKAVKPKKKISDIASEIIAKKEGKTKGEAKRGLFKELLKESNDVLTLLAQQQKDKATELIVEQILNQEKIYTIRDDEKIEMYIYNEGIYSPRAKTYIQEYCREILGDAHTMQLYSRVLSKIIADTFINPENFFITENINKIVVENGILDFTTEKLEKFSPTHILFNKIPVTYDTSKDCPVIKKHFKDILKNSDEDLNVMQELFGYLLLRDNTFEKAFMFLGSGRNGKGKTILLMKSFLGVDNICSIPLQEFSDNLYALSDMLNKMANLGADITDQPLKLTAPFKLLTGRDVISANRKFLPKVKFINYGKVLFSANKLPKTYDSTPSFWERWVFLDFPYRFLNRKDYDKLSEGEIKKGKIKLGDENIIDKITTKDELSGLLNWSLEGLRRLLKQSGFSYSATSEDIKKMWLRKSDSFEAFCMDCLVEDYDSKITKAEMRKAYISYSRSHKLDLESDKDIKRVLSEKMGSYEDRDMQTGKQISCWNGVDFNENSKGSKDSNGFSLYSLNLNDSLKVKPLTNLTTLTKSYMKINQLTPIPKDYTGKCGYCGRDNVLITHKDSNGNHLCKNCYDDETKHNKPPDTN